NGDSNGSQHHACDKSASHIGADPSLVTRGPSSPSAPLHSVTASCRPGDETDLVRVAQVGVTGQRPHPDANTVVSRRCRRSRAIGACEPEAGGARRTVAGGIKAGARFAPAWRRAQFFSRPRPPVATRAPRPAPRPPQ